MAGAIKTGIFGSVLKKMISILIPIFNFDVTGFVRELHAQAQHSGIAFEIRCYDDGSDNEQIKQMNQGIAELPQVVYRELPENIGRSRIRNLLADEAHFESLLFVDCDSKVVNNQYIANYLNHMAPGSIVYGGRSYEAQIPVDKKKILRWLYGHKREAVPVELRKLRPYKSFMTNNFLIPKETYQSIRLNEHLKGYGHEDTLFGQELKEKKIPVIHINNPLCHIGLEDASEFIEKTNEGIENMARLIHNRQVDGDIKLFGYYKAVKKAFIAPVLRKSFKKRKQVILKNLLSERPNLRTFDFYKLGYLLEVMDRKPPLRNILKTNCI